MILREIFADMQIIRQTWIYEDSNVIGGGYENKCDGSMSDNRVVIKIIKTLFWHP